MSVAFTPAEFGSSHRKLFESVVGPRAQALGAKALSDRVALDMAYARKEGDLALVYPAVKQLREVKKGSIPLKDAYALDEQLAIEAAAQAAKATGGQLTSASARFLPTHYRRDFERLAGIKADASPGVALPGVTVQRSGQAYEVKVDFAKALAGVTTREVVLAVSQHFVLTASRVEPPADPSLPPYWLVLSGPDNDDRDLWLSRKTGMSGFGPDSGSLISAGKESMRLCDQSGKKTFATLTFEVDAVNDLGTAVKAPSSGTKAVREAWLTHFKEDEAGFDFAKAVERGALQARRLDEVRDVPGIKTLFSAVREANGGSVSGLYKKGLLELYEDPATKSLAVLTRYDGELGGSLSIVDLEKKRWVGSYRFPDDGSIEWRER